MLIQDIVKISADVLNMDNVVKYLKNNSNKVGDAVAKSEKLTTLTELVINELCQMSFSVSKTDVISTPSNKVAFSSLSEKPLRVLKVCDSLGKELAFSLDGNGVESAYNIHSVEFDYYPKNLSLISQVEFTNKAVTEEMIAMGVVAEYLLTIFDFDGATFWHKRFEDIVKKCVSLKNIKVKTRSWL